MQAQVLAEHGPGARIVAAERVTVGGVWGMFARRHYEVTIEIADPGGTGTTQSPLGRRLPRDDSLIDLPARVGIAALLAAADQVEAHIHSVPPQQQISTNSDEFSDLMDELSFATAPIEAARLRQRPWPRPGTWCSSSDSPTRLGRRPARWRPKSMPKWASPDRCTSMAWSGSMTAEASWRHRARGVERDRSVFVAFGLEHGGQRLPPTVGRSRPHQRRPGMGRRRCRAGSCGHGVLGAGRDGRRRRRCGGDHRFRRHRDPGDSGRTRPADRLGRRQARRRRTRVIAAETPPRLPCATRPRE